MRNERFPELALYSFDTGERFEPDFLLFLRRRSQDGAEFEQRQVYIEPKGEHLADFDRWKEALLMQLGEMATPEPSGQFGHDIILGMPFFNRHQMEGFEMAMAQICK